MYIRIIAACTFSTCFFMKSFDSRIKDIFTRGTISKGHLPQRTFFQGRNLEEIFSEDQNSGTFCQGHFLKDICDIIRVKLEIFN
jgi:hypothetical protein